MLVKSRHRFVPFILGAALLAVGPALADKPDTPLDRAGATTITAIPIDFDRDHPEHKTFGKLVFRGGLNLFAKSTAFGGYSALAIDPIRQNLLAISDAEAGSESPSTMTAAR